MNKPIAIGRSRLTNGRTNPRRGNHSIIVIQIPSGVSRKTIISRGGCSRRRRSRSHHLLSIIDRLWRGRCCGRHRRLVLVERVEQVNELRLVDIANIAARCGRKRRRAEALSCGRCGRCGRR